MGTQQLHGDLANQPQSSNHKDFAKRRFSEPNPLEGNRAYDCESGFIVRDTVWNTRT